MKESSWQCSYHMGHFRYEELKSTEALLLGPDAACLQGEKLLERLALSDFQMLPHSLSAEVSVRKRVYFDEMGGVYPSLPASTGANANETVPKCWC